jgi:DNA modification methylase
MSYINLLTKEGDKVYDAFIGHNSRAEDVLSYNRKYYGYDIHQFPIDFTKKAIERFPKEEWELNCGTSEAVKYESESMDFSITCPPYFDVEPYNKVYNENKIEDLSGKSENDFIYSYSKCLKETYRVLKKGAYFVIVVGDSHKGARYRSLMLETIKICSTIGFQLHDINIYNRKSNIGGDLNYKNFILNSKRFPTIHEFILIFKK